VIGDGYARILDLHGVKSRRRISTLFSYQPRTESVPARATDPIRQSDDDMAMVRSGFHVDRLVSIKENPYEICVHRRNATATQVGVMIWHEMLPGSRMAASNACGIVAAKSRAAGSKVRVAGPRGGHASSGATNEAAAAGSGMLGLRLLRTTLPLVTRNACSTRNATPSVC
jgi:hypothetical protein